MKFIKDYIEKKLKISPLGELKTIPYESTIGDYTGEEIVIDNIETGIIVYYIDYIDWLENDYLINN